MPTLDVYIRTLLRRGFMVRDTVLWYVFCDRVSYKAIGMASAYSQTRSFLFLFHRKNRFEDRVDVEGLISE
jgi:hypothetical protein